MDVKKGVRSICLCGCRFKPGDDDCHYCESSHCVPIFHAYKTLSVQESWKWFPELSYWRRLAKNTLRKSVYLHAHTQRLFRNKWDYCNTVTPGS